MISSRGIRKSRSKFGALAIAGLLGASNALAQGPNQCGPFGNPPATFIANQVPSCGQYNFGDFKGTLLGPIPDSDGTPRYACLYKPAAASVEHKLPMIVYLHPSLFTADSVYESTNLNFYLSSANVSDDPNRPGFVLLAPEGRNTTHHYQSPDDKGLGWDNWYRQFNPQGDVVVNGAVYKENVDAATIDAFVQQLMNSGFVDVNRIYVTGWSNGSAMGFIYGLNRPNIAAIGVYSSPNPFQMYSDPCGQTPLATAPANIGQIQIANPAVPLLHIHNDCDIAGLCPNGELLKSQVTPLGASFDDVIINVLMLQTSSCLAQCGTNPNGDPSTLLGLILGTTNHLRWPFIWTTTMFDFFRQHPLGTH